MYRETYARKTAIRMYASQQSTAAVVQMLLAEGAAPEQADKLAQGYYENYLFSRATASRTQRKRGVMLTTIGAVLTAGSLTLSFLMYLLINDEKGTFIGYYGLLVAGVIALVKGIVDKRQADADLEAVYQLQDLLNAEVSRGS